METNSSAPVHLLPLGDAAWTVEFGECIDPALHARVMGLTAALAVIRRTADGADLEWARLASGVIDVVPTFRSLTVHYDPLAVDGEVLGEALRRLAGTTGATNVQGGRWRIPVCFDDEFAPDLAALAAAKGMTRDEIVGLMTSAEFRVYMIGFMPGFPYMGGLPKVLEMPRLATPRKAVPARSLAVAGAMCAVYPWESPGGWRLLGRTPVPLFDKRNAVSPALLASGDHVVWQAVDRATYDAMEAAASTGAFDRESLRFVQGEG